MPKPASATPASLPLRVNDLLFLNAYFRNGQNATKAYQSVHPNATYGTANGQGQRILQKPSVVAEIERRCRYDVGITKEWGQTRLLDYEAMALSHGDYVAGASIVMDAMRLGGHITEKKEVKTLTDDESGVITALVRSAMRPITVPVPVEPTQGN